MLSSDIAGWRQVYLLTVGCISQSYFIPEKCVKVNCNGKLHGGFFVKYKVSECSPRCFGPLNPNLGSMLLRSKRHHMMGACTAVPLTSRSRRRPCWWRCSPTWATASSPSLVTCVTLCATGRLRDATSPGRGRNKRYKALWVHYDLTIFSSSLLCSLFCANKTWDRLLLASMEKSTFGYSLDTLHVISLRWSVCFRHYVVTKRYNPLLWYHTCRV